MAYSLGNFLTIAYAKEAVLGTAVTSNRFLAGKDFKIDRDPKFITPKLLRGSRTPMVAALAGVRQVGGSIAAPLFPESGMDLFSWSFGQDNTTGTPTQGSGTILNTTTSAPSLVGDSTLAITAGTNSANGQAIVIDSGANVEVAVILSGGASTTLTLTKPLAIAHSSGVAVKTCGSSVGSGGYAAGATGSLLVVSSANLTAADIVQIGTGLTAECHKALTLPDGTHASIASETLTYAHLAGEPVIRLTGTTYTHNITPSVTLPSFTAEKIFSGLTKDLQYPGCLIDQLAIKGATNAEVECTYSVKSLLDQINATPATATFGSDLTTPYSPTTLTVSLNGADDLNVDSFTFDLKNTVIQKDTFNGHDYAQTMVATERMVSMKASSLLTSLDTGSAGYYVLNSGLPSVTYADFSIRGVQGTNTFKIDMPQGALVKVTTPFKMGDLVQYDLDMTAFLGSGTNDVTATVVNGRYLPY